MPQESSHARRGGPVARAGTLMQGRARPRAEMGAMEVALVTSRSPWTARPRSPRPTVPMPWAFWPKASAPMVMTRAARIRVAAEVPARPESVAVSAPSLSRTPAPSVPLVRRLEEFLRRPWRAAAAPGVLAGPSFIPTPALAARRVRLALSLSPIVALSLPRATPRKACSCNPSAARAAPAEALPASLPTWAAAVAMPARVAISVSPTRVRFPRPGPAASGY
ncbi:hypothetical protein BOTU111922_26495 [Bordetella tumulicola]